MTESEDDRGPLGLGLLPRATRGIREQAVEVMSLAPRLSALEARVAALEAREAVRPKTRRRKRKATPTATAAPSNLLPATA